MLLVSPSASSSAAAAHWRPRWTLPQVTPSLPRTTMLSTQSSLRLRPRTKMRTLARQWRSKARASGAFMDGAAAADVALPPPPQPLCCCHCTAAVALCPAAGVLAAATAADAVMLPPTLRCRAAATAAASTLLPPCCGRRAVQPPLCSALPPPAPHRHQATANIAMPMTLSPTNEAIRHETSGKKDLNCQGKKIDQLAGLPLTRCKNRFLSKSIRSIIFLVAMYLCNRVSVKNTK